MADNTQQKHRTNRVFKSLHKPLTYLGVERTLFLLRLCWRRWGLQSLQFHPRGHRRLHWAVSPSDMWVTNSDPAFLRILARSERYKLRYDAAKQQVPRVEVL